MQANALNIQAVVHKCMSNSKYCKLSKLRGVWVLADCSVTCVCFHCDADMSVMHVSWSRRWDQGEEEDGGSSGHVRRHVRKRGVYLSRLWGGRPGRASVRRQHRLTSVQIGRGETRITQTLGMCLLPVFLFFFLFFCSPVVLQQHALWIHNSRHFRNCFQRTSCSLL